MRLLAALAFGALLVIPARSMAWTEAEIETLRAELHIGEDANVRVEMTLQLHVRGGWLERLEVAGLDEGFVLDEESVRFRGEGQPRYPRVVRRDDGRLQFSFARREAPRRGHYEISFTYRTDLSASARPEGERTRYDWTLPGWRTGLDGVEVVVVGPSSLRFAESEDVLATIAKERSQEGDEATLTWKRAHLPRTVPWTLGFTFGGPSPAPTALVDAPEDAALETGPSESEGQTPLAWLSLLTLLGLLSFRGRANRYGVAPRPLIPLPTAIRVVLLLGIGALSLVDHTSVPLLGPGACFIAILLGFERTPAAAAAPRLGTWRPLGSRERLPIVHRPWDAFFDGTSLVGGLSLCAVVAPAWILGPWGIWTLALVTPWLTGTRRQLPLDLVSKRQRLLQVAATAPAGAYALGLAIHECASGKGQDVRLRIATKHRCPGLVRFDVVSAERQGPGGLYAVERVLVVAREESPAHAIATSHFADDAGHATPGGRTVWAAPLNQIRTLASLLGAAPKRKKRRQSRRAQPAAPLSASA
ncbi:MAG: hypothetical protein ACI9KE_003091 [Polyangiales bacterium]